ncbi:hypothetical protein [Alkalibacillus haloalkaliphilus]|uniref:hypothetical protein n=1 Tax=Alkalibacillus haloalkaliphilus TaxID=94136 RepID=UPI0029353763|nr:hypothetical protein [Alkalibacillus haloalkaliphilus]MDV2582382.1 hypothetical protein [Alkalibacillus haloalkaliphilus]
MDETDCATIEEYKDKKKQIQKASFLAGILWGLFMLIFTEYLFPYLINGEINLSWWNISIWGLGGTFFGITMYWLSKSKLKKHF